jgi:hemerythrin-like domain-containing protein
LVELLDNQPEEFKEKVEDIKEVFVKGIEISGECMKSLNESITNKMEEHTDDIKNDVDNLSSIVIDGFENLSDVLDVRTERITLNTNSLFNAICGTLEEPSLEAKLATKIDEQAEEIKSLKRKLDENNELLTQIIKRLGHITR